MAKPTAVEGAVFDPAPANDLGSLNTLIGFDGSTSTGIATGPEGQVAEIHTIGSATTTIPGVIGGMEVTVNAVAPTISGPAAVGKTVTGDPGTWTGKIGRESCREREWQKG